MWKILKGRYCGTESGVPYDSPYLEIARKSGAEIVNEAALF